MQLQSTCRFLRRSWERCSTMRITHYEICYKSSQSALIITEAISKSITTQQTYSVTKTVWYTFYLSSSCNFQHPGGKTLSTKSLMRSTFFLGQRIFKAWYTTSVRSWVSSVGLIDLNISNTPFWIFLDPLNFVASQIINPHDRTTKRQERTFLLQGTLHWWVCIWIMHRKTFLWPFAVDFWCWNVPGFITLPATSNHNWMGPNSIWWSLCSFLGLIGFCSNNAITSCRNTMHCSLYWQKL